LVLILPLFEQHDEEQGQKHLQALRAMGQNLGSKTLEYLCHVIEAWLCSRRGEETTSLEHLRQALKLSREAGGLTMMTWGPAMMSCLYAKALEAGIEVEFVRELIRRMQLTPPDPATAPDNWPWPIKVYTLGRFSVVKDGEPLRFTGKGQKKPLELLQCLIALGGREVPEGQIDDLLWPDAEGDAAYRSLITTLQRLRQWLGHPEAVELSGGQLSFNPKSVWVDNWNFERVLGQAEASRKNGTGASLPSLTGKALALYRGPFLDKTDCPWAIARREKLRAKFIHHLLARGQALETAGQWDEAIACYLRGIEADELVEAFHQQLIRCYQHLGRTAEAGAVAGRWRKILATAGLHSSA
jgi:DNA-binding SARP family transcriptional activator